MPELSKSVVVERFGGYDCLKVQDFALPELKGLIELEVEYAGLNFADLYMRKGLFNRELPFVLGMEAAGRITAVGATATNLKVGQRVISYNVNGGLFREKVRVAPKTCFPIPDDVDTKTAAAIFVNYLTAYFAIFHSGSVKPNDDVFIDSCGGGVGWAATQLAKTIPGVRVFGTTSIWKENDVKENGVYVVIPRNNFVDFQNYYFDVIIANQTGNMLQLYMKQLKPLGRLVMLGANNIITDENKLSPFDLLKLWWQTKHIKPIDLVMSNISVSGLHLAMLLEKDQKKVRAALEEIFDLLRNGKIKPRIHAEFKIDGIIEASMYLAERKNIGKVLIKM